MVTYTARMTDNWSTENSDALHEVPLYDLKVEVWCTVSTRRIIGPVSFLRNSKFPALCETESVIFLQSKD
jgi:hypothetical protein